MAIKATNPSQDLLVGDVWTFDLAVTDADGCAVADSLAVTVTDPSGTDTTPAPEELAGVGAYRLAVTLDAPGRWLAAVAGSQGAAAATAYAQTATDATGMPTIVDLGGTDGNGMGYLGTHSYTDQQLQDALDAEAAAQRRTLRMPAVYSADLRQALLRRAARALALMRINVNTEIDGETGRNTVPSGLDREIRRYEAPYRRLPVG